MLADGHVTASVAIIDDDVPEVSIGFEQSSYAVAEGRSVTVRVLLSAEPERPVAVQLTVVEQDGATSADYSGAPASVTFTEEETEQTFTFAASADDTYEDGESVLFGLDALPERVRAGAIAGTKVFIKDDDLPQVAVSFDVRSYTVTEGGRVRVGLGLTPDPQRTGHHPHHRDELGWRHRERPCRGPAEGDFRSGRDGEDVHPPGHPRLR